MLPCERMQTSHFSRGHPPIVVRGYMVAFPELSRTRVLHRTHNLHPHTHTRTAPRPPLCLALLSPASRGSTKRPLCESTVTSVAQHFSAVLSHCHSSARTHTEPSGLGGLQSLPPAQTLHDATTTHHSRRKRRG